MMTDAEWMQHGRLPPSVVVRAWFDSDYRQLLLENPVKAFHDIGIKFDKAVSISVVANTEDMVVFALPSTPSNINDLNEKDAKLYVIGTGQDGPCAATGTCK